MTKLLIIIIVNTNLKVSSTNVCFHSVVKMEMMKVKQKMIKNIPKGTLITSPAIIVDKNFTMRETLNSLHRKNLKRMHKHSEKKNQGKYGNKTPNGEIKNIY